MKMTHLLLEDANLKQIQKMLIDKGFDLGPTGADGLWGPYTAKAVQAAVGGQSTATSTQQQAPVQATVAPTQQPAPTKTTAPVQQQSSAPGASTGEAGTTQGRQFVSYKSDPNFLPNPSKSEKQNQIEWEGKQRARGGYGTNTTYRDYDSSLTPQQNAMRDYTSRMARQGYGGASDNVAGVPDASPEDKAYTNSIRDMTGTQANPNQAELNRQAFTKESAELKAMLRIAGLR